MAVINILKDGSVIKDLTGHIVRMEDAGPLYQLIDTINRERSEKQSIHKKVLKEVSA
jgi:hypothetical protein